MNSQLRLLLVMPRRRAGFDKSYIFSLGIPSISSPLKLIGFDVFTLNLNHYEAPVESVIADHIRLHNINVIATGGNSADYSILRDIFDAAKATRSSITTVAGGGIISAEPEVAMTALENVDFGVIGEGEVAICELILFLEAKMCGQRRALEFTPDLASCVAGGEKISEFHAFLSHHDTLDEIQSIIFKRNGKFVQTPTRPEIKDLAVLPWIDYQGFEIEKNLDAPTTNYFGNSSKRTIYTASGRSCPYHCTFCFHTNAKKYRQRNIEDFCREVDYLIDKYDIDSLSIVDDLFAFKADRLRRFCSHMKKYNNRIRVFISLRADVVDDGLMTILKEAPYLVVFLGLESADDRILKSMRKGITHEQAASALQRLYDNGIVPDGAMIFGDIAETLETAQNTLDFIAKHPQYNIRPTFIIPYPGTEVYQYACKNGYIKDPVAYLRAGCPRINFSKMTNEDYNYIAEEISKIIASYPLLQDVRLREYNSSSCRATVEGDCPRCAKSLTFSEIILTIDDYYICQHCSAKILLPLPLELHASFRENVLHLVSSSGKVVFWGALNFMQRMLPLVEDLPSDDILLVDFSMAKWGSRIAGRTVQNPEVILSRGIQTVIIASLTHASTIRATLHHDFSCVTNVKIIVELLSPPPY